MLESAFNIVYGQPNRSFLRGKLLAVGLMLVSLVTLFLGLLAGSVGFDLLTRYAAGVAGNSYVAYALSVAVSTIAVFVFLFAVYYLLTNVEHSFTDVLPGHRRRSRAAGGELPGAADLRALLEQRRSR